MDFVSTGHLPPSPQVGTLRTNPMVNPGAIATTSLLAGWKEIRDGLSRFAGRPLLLDDEVYASASETNQPNRELDSLLEEAGRIYADPVEAVDLYTRQCSLSVSAHDLAVMGATLADGGVNPSRRSAWSARRPAATPWR